MTFQIEVIGKSTVMFCSTKSYEFYGDDENELGYINLDGGVTTIQLMPGDQLNVFGHDGSHDVDHFVEESL